MENLLLSIDGDISLYKVEKEVYEKLDDLLKEFDKWKKTNCYDETLFVEFIKNKYGNDSIEFVKVVGECNAGDLNEELDRFEDLIEEEYKDTKKINF